LRKRFNSLLEALNLDTKRTIDGRPFGLGSLRAGGATHLLLETENPDLVRRRGRWLAHRTMEIYLQEVLVTTFTSKLQAPTRDKIHVLASVFPKVAVKAILFLRSAIPTQVWYQLFQADDAEELGWCWGFMDSAFGKNCLHLDEISWPRRENGDGVMLDTKHLTELLISSSPTLLKSRP